MSGIPLLAARTDFSSGESSLQVKKLVAAAKEKGYSAVCVVDTMTLGAMPALFDAAKKSDIKALIGVTIRVVNNPSERTKSLEQGLFQIKAYPRNENGLRSLFALLSKGLSKENFYYHSRVSLDDVLLLDDVVITTGDIHSVWHRDDAASIVAKLAANFPTYVEIVALETPLFHRLNSLAAATATSQVLPKLITRPVMYLEPEDADSTDVMRAITVNGSMDNIFLARPYARDMAVLTRLSMLTKMSASYRQATERSLTGFDLQVMESFVEQCAYKFEKMAPCLPKMAEDEFKALMQKVQAGWAVRFATPVWGHRPDDLNPYKERLAFELGVIRKMGFSGYFLLVQEIVEFAKGKGILVGPGRGSVGGSLIAYLMGITDIDPIRFGLLFERFINPDRIDLPDADLDFMSARRHEIVDYLTEKYGQDYVCGIVNFSTLGPASALRDSARVHGLPPYEYACSKQMEKEHGVSLSLTESADAVPDIDKFRQERPIIWDHALRLEGVNRTLSQHAAGVVVAGEPIINRGVVSMQPGHPVVQWDKSRVEDFGLIKIDVLGLSTLDVIAQVIKYIGERHKKKINTLALPLDDAKVLKAFGAGDTVGVFQFEGSGMRKLLRELGMGGPLTFDDICAATALFRPGPLDAGLCDRYVQVKQGAATATFDHPALEECLGDTFGVIVYQEQVMKITRVLCGFTPGDSDGVRKAIGKKDAAKMAEYEVKFVSGAVANGMEEFQAAGLWQTILGFAGYAFNKSHSSAYSLISWITMWLKVHYPAEFYAGALSVVENEDKQASLIADAQSKGFKVLPPCILSSTDRIEIRGEWELIAPFQAVKGISSGAATALMRLREHFGSFTLAEPEKVTRRRKQLDGKFAMVEEIIPGHIKELTTEAQQAVLGRSKVNSAAVERLEKVGALFKLKGGLPPLHPDRLRDRLEYLPGYTIEKVKATRGLAAEHLAKIKITQLVEEVRGCIGCDLQGKPHPVPRMGDAPKFMVVSDAPNFKEEREGKLLAGDSADIIKACLKDVGLKVGDGYYTTLVKSAKPREQKVLSNAQINACKGYLAREIDILKPPVIIAMGSNSIKYFAPDIKGNPADLAGKAIYRADLDATIIFGLNPGMLFHDPSKISLVQAVFNTLSETLS